MRAKSPGWISLTEGVEKEGQKSLSRWKPRLQGRSATSHTTDKAARSVWTRRLPRLHPLAYKTKQIRAPKWLADDHAGEAQETTINLFKRLGSSGFHLWQHVAVGLQTLVIERDKDRTACFSKL